jgi:hypothetical protein
VIAVVRADPESALPSIVIVATEYPVAGVKVKSWLAPCSRVADVGEIEPLEF